MARKHMCSEVYEALVEYQWPHNPHFVENSHERPFSIVPKANTFGFLTKKWSPPEIKECDLWQGNICGVRFTSLWSMIKKEFKLKTLFKQKKLHARLFFKYYSLHPKI
jgi:hypothetical protein